MGSETVRWPKVLCQPGLPCFEVSPVSAPVQILFRHELANVKEKKCLWGFQKRYLIPSILYILKNYFVSFWGVFCLASIKVTYTYEPETSQSKLEFSFRISHLCIHGAIYNFRIWLLVIKRWWERFVMKCILSKNMVYDCFANPWTVQKNLFWGKWLIIPKRVHYIAQV